MGERGFAAGIDRSIPYKLRTDEQKLQTQWAKALGLMQRQDWSAAVVRASTATELAANLALRACYTAEGRLTPGKIKKKIRNLCGLTEKLGKLLTLLDDEPKARLMSIKPHALSIATKRNHIVHEGEFCDPEEAIAHRDRCKVFVEGLVTLFVPEFALTAVPIQPEEELGA